MEPTGNSSNEADGIILHIASAADWATAQSLGFYEVPSLQTEGFIHCSRPHQVAEVANRLFRGRHDLIILLIDSSLLSHEVRYERAENGQRYPHVYGPVILTAVVRTFAWRPGLDGRFSFHASLSGTAAEDR